MTQEKFVKAVKLQTSDAAVSGTIASLKRPPGRKPSERLVQLSRWYNQLANSDQEILKEAVKEAAEMAVFEFFCVLDGVTAIDEGSRKGDLELYYVSEGSRIRLNDPAKEELHNTFNALCREDSQNNVQI